MIYLKMIYLKMPTNHTTIRNSSHCTEQNGLLSVNSQVTTKKCDYCGREIKKRGEREGE